MPISTVAEPRNLKTVVDRLLMESVPAEHGKRRTHKRYPFCRPVNVTLNPTTGPFIAFTRNISSGGIGLLHHVPLLVNDEVLVTIPTDSDNLIRLQAKIEWCKCWGGSWYCSGGRLLGIVDGDAG